MPRYLVSYEYEVDAETPEDAAWAFAGEVRELQKMMNEEKPYKWLRLFKINVEKAED